MSRPGPVARRRRPSGGGRPLARTTVRGRHRLELAPRPNRTGDSRTRGDSPEVPPRPPTRCPAGRHRRDPQSGPATRSADGGEHEVGIGREPVGRVTPPATPIARPAPASRAIRRSAGVSPTIAVRSIGTPSPAARPRSAAGSGFVGPGRRRRGRHRRGRRGRGPRASPRSVAGHRSSRRRSAVRSRAGPSNSASRSASGTARATGSGSNHASARIRRAAATLGHQRRSTAADELLDPGHRRERERPAGLDAVGDRVVADRRVDVAGDRPPRRHLQPRPELARPAAPHRLERDQRPVLVEDDEVDAVEDRVDGQRAATGCRGRRRSPSHARSRRSPS